MDISSYTMAGLISTFVVGAVALALWLWARLRYVRRGKGESDQVNLTWVLYTIGSAFALAASYIWTFDTAQCDSRADVVCMLNNNQGVLTFAALIVASGAIWLSKLQEDRRQAEEHRVAAHAASVALQEAVSEVIHNLQHIGQACGTREPPEWVSFPVLETASLTRLPEPEVARMLPPVIVNTAMTLARATERVRAIAESFEPVSLISDTHVYTSASVSRLLGIDILPRWYRWMVSEGMAPPLPEPANADATLEEEDQISSVELKRHIESRLLRGVIVSSLRLAYLGYQMNPDGTLQLPRGLLRAFEAMRERDVAGPGRAYLTLQSSDVANHSERVAQVKERGDYLFVWDDDAPIEGLDTFQFRPAFAHNATNPPPQPPPGN